MASFFQPLPLLLWGLLAAWLGGQGTCVGETRGAALPEPSDWRSEAFSEEASDQLKALSKAMLSAEGGKALGTSWQNQGFISGAKASALRPEASRVFQDDWVEVREVPRAETKPEANLSLGEAWNDLVAPYSGGVDRAKFKVIEVDVSEPASPRSRQLVTLGGVVGDGYVEMNATWSLAWRWDGETAPRMAEVILESWEEVTVRGTERPFKEATREVIGQSPAFQEQLRYGNNHWRQRIELFNRFFKFGHHGLAVGDVNGDGLEDVYVCQNGGLPNRLFLQQPDGTAVDVARESGVDLLDLTRSALLVDLDNDDDQDLVLAADTGLLAFRNDGTGRFAPKIRYPGVRNAFGVSAADYDNDGDLDLYVCRYFANKEEGAGLAVPVPYFNANNGGGNFLIRNEGMKPGSDWLHFSDATAASGLEAANNRRFSFAAVWEDLDEDGDQDLFVANDFGLKNLYVNENGRFRDIASEAGIDDGGFGMSAASGDFDGDGRMDLYAGNMFSAAGSRVTRQPQFRPGIAPELLKRFQHLARGNTLFRNLGDGRRYADVSEMAGVTVGRWSWGSVFADLNNDGWQDLVVANGFVTGRVPDDL